MVAAGLKTPSQSAIYHYPEMMKLIAEQTSGIADQPVSGPIVGP